MAGKTVAVLGGGIGGLIAANHLRRLLNREHRVIVVDRTSRHAFYPSLPWLAMGWRRADSVTWDLSKHLHRGVEFVQGEVAAIDLGKRQVAADGAQIPFDYLVVALGAELAPQAIPGLPEAYHSYYDLDSAQKLAAALPSFQEGTVAVVISSLPYKCPAAPYEGAFLLDYLFRKRGRRDRVSVSIYTPEPAPLPVAGERIGEAVKGMLAARDISYRPGVRLASVDSQARELVFESGERARFDLLVAVPPHRSPEVVRTSGLANPAGWIPVNARTLETSIEGVYAIGDVAAVSTPSGLPLPKAGVFAHGEAEVVARSIARRIAGDAAPAEFQGHGTCFLEIGYGKAGMATGDFYAEPKPAVAMRDPGRRWHWAKLLFEQRWLRGWV